MKHLWAVVALLPLPLMAGPHEDAAFIVEEVYSPETMAASFDAFRPMMIATSQAELGKVGITLSDPDRFFDLFIPEFQDEYLASLRTEMTKVFEAKFTPDQLHDIAAFMATPSGKAYLAAQGDLVREGASVGQRVGSVAGRNAGLRLADKLESEGLLQTENPSVVDSLVKWLRGG